MHILVKLASLAGSYNAYLFIYLFIYTYFRFIYLPILSVAGKQTIDNVSYSWSIYPYPTANKKIDVNSIPPPIH